MIEDLERAAKITAYRTARTAYELGKYEDKTLADEIMVEINWSDYFIKAFEAVYSELTASPSQEALEEFSKDYRVSFGEKNKTDYVHFRARNAAERIFNSAIANVKDDVRKKSC